MKIKREREKEKMKNNIVFTYAPFIVSIALFIFVLSVGSTLFKERTILTKKGLFIDFFCAAMFVIGILFIILSMIDMVQSILFVFIGGILLGFCLIGLGYSIKYRKYFFKENISLKSKMRKNSFSYKVYWGFGWSIIMLFLFIGGCLLIKFYE
jgi:membrane-associated HD superfamily phosphohydrolase